MMRACIYRGLLRHFALTLRLNFRSRQAVIYGFVMPVLFLLAFAGIFRGDTPLLQHEMGQLLTITILGGACFGLPTAVVAERERGLWRRYRLLPAPMGGILLATLAARLVLLAAAALLQVVLARAIYGTPLPAAPTEDGIQASSTPVSFSDPPDTRATLTALHHGRSGVVGRRATWQNVRTMQEIGRTRTEILVLVT